MRIKLKIVLVCLILAAGFAFTSEMTFAFQEPVDPATEAVATKAIPEEAITAAKEELHESQTINFLKHHYI